MHTIRLRGPWSAASADDDPLSPRDFDWDKGIREVLARAGAANCSLSRKFNLPTGLRPEDEVHVATSGLAIKTLRINGQLISSVITQHLQPRNVLEIVCSGLDGSLPPDELPLVLLEIHEKGTKTR